MSASNAPKTLSGSGDIRVIGDRGCGKTTYLAALAYWPNHDPTNSPIQSIEPFDPDTGELIQQAENILKIGGRLSPTDNPEDPDQAPLYTVLIDLKPRLFFQNRNVRIQVSCREYGGELYEELSKSSTEKLGNYLNDCASSSGLMILIDGTSALRDQQYAQALKNLESELNMRLAANNRKPSSYRIAVVFTKGENASVWVSREDLPGFVNRKFPRMQIALKTWTVKWGCSYEYFIASAFGTMGENPPKPNVKGGSGGVIARPDFWKPFGLVAPIYWLYTGQKDERLKNL